MPKEIVVDLIARRPIKSVDGREIIAKSGTRVETTVSVGLDKVRGMEEVVARDVLGVVGGSFEVRTVPTDGSPVRTGQAWIDHVIIAGARERV